MNARRWFRQFAVRGVFWRRYLDFGVTNVPIYLRTVMIVLWTCFFFFFAAPARRAILSNLAVILPGSSRLANYARAWLTLFHFAWTISDAADHKLARTEFAYEVEGEEFLDQLAAARGAILLTAHMGNYDLGAALFAQRYQRELHVVRAPEEDPATARHLDESLERASGGGVKVAYNTSATALPLELLNALRSGEIVSVQGDRAMPAVSQRKAWLFGEVVRLPDGPFILALVAGTPIYPLFIWRTGFHHYKILTLPPFHCHRAGDSREAAVEAALATWCRTLESVVRRNWSQWFSLVPIFPSR
ncbi:MAG TPA: lysophospholipid acyltransferase family protein [Chthoniobacterales bacterium]|jgi:lauroyl/myristoyl acyltransferase